MSSIHYVPKSSATGLIERATQLYGRESELEQILRLLAKPPDAPLAILLDGEGGTGKTSLLLKVEDQLRPSSAFLPVYDFYHIDNFKAGSIETAIIDALESSDDSAALFAPYAHKRRELEHARQTGHAFQLAQRQLRETFIDCYNQYADRERQRDRAVVLLFDSVEQGVDLSDEAEIYMIGTGSDANKGGALWLEATLPQLRNTVAIVAGRSRTLYGHPVDLYSVLQQRMDVHTITLGGIPIEAERQFILDQLAALTGPGQPDDIRELARSVEFNDQTFLVWRVVSDGFPFWDSMLLTCTLLGAIPSEMDRLHEAVFADQPIDVIPYERQHIRAAVMREILERGVSQNDHPMILVLQWMAFLRKGATPTILKAVAQDQGLVVDIDEMYERLKKLDIVKVRRSPYTRPLDSDQEDMLFLHDEVYYWLDQHFPTQQLLRSTISAVVLNFYNEKIDETERRQIAAKDRLLKIGRNHFESPALIDQIEEEMRRQRRLVLDYVGYCYQYDIELGRQVYNLQSYAAILNREVDYGVTLRQESLRSIYRLYGKVPFNIIVESAAHWVLRALHTDDMDTMELVEKLDYYYGQEANHPGSHYALLYLADAQARIYFGIRLETEQALVQLYRAQELATAYERIYREQHRNMTDQWIDFLQAEVAVLRGFYYRQSYKLPQAIQDYRRALSFYLRQPNLLREFLGGTLNNLAFAYSEQGEVDEARRFGQQGLVIIQRYGSTYRIGLAYNTLARIELRAGRSDRATRFAQQARALFSEIGSIRGLSLCLPVLAESYREQAEQFDDSISEQEATFQQAVEILQEAHTLLETQQIVSPDRRRESYQVLGWVYRSWAVTLMRRRTEDMQIARAHFYFNQAQHWLERALEIAMADQPPVIRMDIYENLAVVLIDQNQFDQRVEDYLRMAEKLAPPEYRIEQAIGLRDVKDPVRPYWRLLGQCELQRMLVGFGKYDFGVYEQREDGTAYYTNIGNERYLKDAACHLVLTLAYVYKYSYHSLLLDRVRSLALGKLRLARSEQQLKLMAQEAYRTAREYRLLGTPALMMTEELIRQAHGDLELPLALVE